MKRRIVWLLVLVVSMFACASASAYAADEMTSAIHAFNAAPYRRIVQDYSLFLDGESVYEMTAYLQGYADAYDSIAQTGRIVSDTGKMDIQQYGCRFSEGGQLAEYHHTGEGWEKSLLEEPEDFRSIVQISASMLSDMRYKETITAENREYDIYSAFFYKNNVESDAFAGAPGTSQYIINLAALAFSNTACTVIVDAENRQIVRIEVPCSECAKEAALSSILEGQYTMEFSVS